MDLRRIRLDMSAVDAINTRCQIDFQKLTAVHGKVNLQF